MMAPSARTTPYFSRLTWFVFIAGLLTFPLMLVHGGRHVFDFWAGDDDEILSGCIAGTGLVLLAGAPWLSPRPIFERGLFSAASASLWAGGIFAVMIVGVVALTYENEAHSHQIHAQEIETAFSERLLPAAAFVRGFVEREHRLPSDDEMESAGWPRGVRKGGSLDGELDLYRKDPQWGDGWGVVGKDFMLGTSVPGWNLYYCSWNEKRIEANWP